MPLSFLETSFQPFCHTLETNGLICKRILQKNKVTFFLLYLKSLKKCHRKLQNQYQQYIFCILYKLLQYWVCKAIAVSKYVWTLKTVLDIKKEMNANAILLKFMEELIYLKESVKNFQISTTALESALAGYFIWKISPYGDRFSKKHFKPDHAVGKGSMEIKIIKSLELNVRFTSNQDVNSSLFVV